MKLQRIGVLTGGGDCSGLNAVLRAVVRTAGIQHDIRVFGFEMGFDGLIFDRWQELTTANTRDILSRGGTLLGATNKGNPFAYKTRDENGNIQTKNLSARALDNFNRLKLDCLIAIGGEGTLEIAHQFSDMGMPVIAVPKTIDNDLAGTDYTFGFQTAVQVACDSLDRLHTTGKSHQRVMILEVMGRTAGWIALESGISGGAHIILIPEIPYIKEKVLEKIRLREAGGHPYTVIVVAEGASEAGGAPVISESAAQRLQNADRLGGVGHALARDLESRLDHEVRCTVLGYIQRGGSPNSFDRILATRLGAYAVRAAVEQKFGNLVVLRTPDITLQPLAEVAGKVRLVPPDCQLLQTAEDIGISLGR